MVSIKRQVQKMNALPSKAAKPHWVMAMWCWQRHFVHQHVQSQCHARSGFTGQKSCGKRLESRATHQNFAGGSRVVAEYLNKSGLQIYLDQLGFNVVAFGCTTCIGNSGDLAPEINEAILSNDVIAAAVLSGNRNFEAGFTQTSKPAFSPAHRWWSRSRLLVT